MWITDILEDEGQALAAELGQGHRFERLDVAVESDLDLVERLVREEGRLDVLVNNGGILAGSAASPE